MPLRGSQQPRILSVPPSALSSAGQEAVGLARAAGLDLDPWQELVLEHSLAERADGNWAARRVGLCVPRQNGKGSILEARELAGLFLLGESDLVHSAHLASTSTAHFERIVNLIENEPSFMSRVAKNGIRRANGEQGIRLKTGATLAFRTRTSGGARGLTGDFVALDEAMYLSNGMMGALLPIISARANAQVWFTGSAVDQLEHEHGEAFARIRAEGVAGGEDGVMYAEWSPAGADNPAEVTSQMARDPAVWAEANPAYGIRITGEAVEQERRALPQRTFAVERLNVGDWPSLNEGEGAVIRLEDWDRLADGASKLRDGAIPRFSFDVSPDRSKSAIAVAGRREDGLVHVEIIEHRKGTSWVAGRLVELCEKYESDPPLYDNASPAASLVPALEALGWQPESLDSRDLAEACGQFFDLVTDDEPKLRHLGTAELRSALKGAAKRPLGDAWAWTRTRSVGVDICPLVAATVVAANVSSVPEYEPFVMWS